MGPRTTKQQPKRESDVNNNDITTITIARVSKQRFSLSYNNLSQYTVIWLDETSTDNSVETLLTKVLLRQLNIHNCLFYDNKNTFLNELENKTLPLKSHEKLLIITSGIFARQILPRLSSDVISTVIIFCSSYKNYVELSKTFSNFIGICTDHETLKSCIQRALSSLRLNLRQTLKTVRPLQQNNTNTYFMYILFVELLKQLPQTDYAKDTMLHKCKDYYRGDENELKKIKEFHCKYTSDQAIEWYTKDSFVYRLVNQIFRIEDITLWFLFRFYIVDLCNQLEQVHNVQKTYRHGILTVYRGQAQLPVKEFDHMQHNIGSLFATNGFWSTSKSRDIALQFTIDAVDTDEFKVVLFEITVDQTRLENLVFVDIEKLNKCDVENEKEVLFTIGSVFKLENIHWDETLKLWKISVIATDESTEQVKTQIKLMKLKYQHENNSNLLFGRFLLDFGHYSKAESYFQLMLQLDNEVTSSVYHYLGNLYMSTTNWQEAHKNFSLSLHIKTVNKSLYNAQDFGITYIGLGNYYKAIEDFSSSYDYYTKALSCWDSKHDHINIAITKLNLASIYSKDFETALDLCFEARDILEQHKHQPPSYIEIIYCNYLIGNIYCKQSQFDRSEGFYLVAFEMSERYLPVGNYHRLCCIKALSELYKKKDENNIRALKFCYKQLQLHEECFTKNHFSIAHLLMSIGDLLAFSMDEEILKFYQRALEILLDNQYIEYVATANCFLKLGDLYNRRAMYRKSVKSYHQAYEIQKKIYPNHHKNLLETERLIDLADKNLISFDEI